MAIKFIGKILYKFGIKEQSIKIYEKIYDFNRKIQMYILYPFDYIYKKNHNINMLSMEETLDYIIKNKCSISRFGDGEFNLVSNNSIGFQDNNYQLVKDLRNILCCNDKNCLICLPGMFSFENEYVKSMRIFFLKMLVHKRKEWYSYLNMNMRYGNADITRCYVEFNNYERSKIIFSLLRKIWENKEVLIVEGELSRLGVGDDLFNNCKDIKRLLCPHKNAYSSLPQIENWICSNVSQEKLILIALGPTASVLSYFLSQNGYQAIDIGNVDKEYEWFFQKSEKKLRNPLKFSMEVSNGTNVEECNDINYLNQIIYRINC